MSRAKIASIVKREGSSMSKQDVTSWQTELLNMKSHSPSDTKLLIEGVEGLKDAWQLGIRHVEYERLKKIKERQQE